jgi:TRAP-type mannitol/chloroaromatic compound transport system permease small subunit
MTDAGGRRGVPGEAHGRSALAGFCAAVDRLNTWVAGFWGASIIFVTFAILYEVIARGLFGQATVWANETTVYLSAVAYLLGGGYALLRRGHVRIDLIYGVLPPAPRLIADILSFVFFALYVGALVWVGTQMAWGSFLQSEGTGTPWNPPIWPVKMAIPVAGLLLFLQGIVNLLRDLGLVPEARNLGDAPEAGLVP